MEQYDPTKDSWRAVSPMREKRINFGAASVCGFVYAVGGHNGVAYLSSMERYDPYTDQWTAVTGMGQPRTGKERRINVLQYHYIENWPDRLWSMD